MKLSDVKGDRAIDVIADIIGPICNIAQDKAASELFSSEPLPPGQAEKAATERLKNALPKILKGHKQDIIEILASIAGEKPKDFAAHMDLVTLLRDCIDLIEDEEFLRLFSSARTRTDAGGSASTRGNTTERKA